MRQKDEMERTENARARSNRHILWLTYGIAALFIAMAVYFGWFIQFKSENVIGSSYNARLDLLSDRVTRGSIMSNDKTVQVTEARNAIIRMIICLSIRSDILAKMEKQVWSRWRISTCFPPM